MVYGPNQNIEQCQLYPSGFYSIEISSNQCGGKEFRRFQSYKSETQIIAVLSVMPLLPN